VHGVSHGVLFVRGHGWIAAPPSATQPSRRRQPLEVERHDEYGFLEHVSTLRASFLIA
jgi:hypothetical protein